MNPSSKLSKLKTATTWDKAETPITGFDGDEPNTVDNLNTNIEYLMKYGETN